MVYKKYEKREGKVFILGSNADYKKKRRFKVLKRIFFAFFAVLLVFFSAFLFFFASMKINQYYLENFAYLKVLKSPGPEIEISEIWSVSYYSGGIDTAKSIAVDNQGAVYVTGQSNNNYYTIKYNATNGSEIWNVSYDNSETSDSAYGIAVDNQGAVYVTGAEALDTSGNGLYHTIKYNSTNGSEIWNAVYDNVEAMGIFDSAYGIAVDNTGVYVTGNSNDKDYTIKYNATNGSQIWNVSYSSFGLDSAYGIAVDNQGAVYVTGYSNPGADANYYTIKYNTTNGSQTWAQTFDSGSTVDTAYGIAVDSSGNVYVTGFNETDSSVIKYNSIGSQIWNVTYDSGTTDSMYGIALDNSGNIYVTGVSNGSYTTIKYNSSGSQIWNKTDINGTAYGIAIDNQNYIYITGNSSNKYYTIKYSNTTASVGEADSIPPSVYLLNPVNEAILSNSSVAFGANATDDVNVSNVTLFVWNSSDILINRTTDQTSGVSVIANISVTLPRNDTYRWNYYACDNSTIPNCAWNITNRSLVLGKIPLLITINSPLSQTYSASTIDFNVSLNKQGYCLYSLDAGITNITMNSEDNLSFFDSSSLSDGAYTVNFYCNDSSGNRNDSMRVSFTINISSPPDTTPPGGGGGIPSQNCTSSWQCSSWTECINEKRTRTCVDKNKCNSSSGKPVESESCIINPIEEPSPNKTLKGECGSWSSCNIIYSLEDLITNNIILKGEQIRFCFDKDNNIFYAETRKCDTTTPITISKSKDYVEIFDSNKTLVSRIRFDKITKMLDIQLPLVKTYYPYCYDGIKNYDEDEIDCVYNKDGNCPQCRAEISLKKYRCRIWFIPCWLFALIIIVISIFIMIKFIMIRKNQASLN